MINKFIYYYLHMFKCPDEDLEVEYNGSQARCRKCGRTKFIWK
ncbi:MAG: hypothetical protein ACRCX2_19525 [Paraclostridium sp.]